MTVAALQYDIQRGRPGANLAAAERLLDGLDADLVVLPELAASGYFFESTAQARDLSEPIPDGPTVRALQRWARETGMSFVAGVAERDGDTLYNSAVVVTPKGWLGTYRKTHLFYQETLHFAPGDSGFRVWTLTDRRGTSYRLGVMVCFDWLFPEAARTLALQGADVIAHPSNLVLPHCPQSMPLRALENGAFTITANRTGEESVGDETLSFIGRSVICGPDASVLARADGRETRAIVADLDPRRARDKAFNAYNERVGDRRPELYAR